MQALDWFVGPCAPAKLQVCRIKNKFSFSSEDLVGGYRDLMLLVVFEGTEGLRIVGEIQLQDAALHSLKLKVNFEKRVAMNHQQS